MITLIAIKSYSSQLVFDSLTPSTHIHRNMGAAGMRDNSFPSTFSATGGTSVGGTMKRDSTLLRGGTIPRGTIPRGTSAVIDDFTPTYEPKGQSSGQRSSKKTMAAPPAATNPSFASRARGQHNPTYIDDVDDEFDYLY